MSCASQSSNGSTTSSSEPGMSGSASHATSYRPRASSGRCAQVTISTPSGGSTGGGSISDRCSTTPSSLRSSTNPRAWAKARLSGSLSNTGASSSRKAASDRPGRHRRVQRGADAAPPMLGKHGDEREDAVGPLRQDNADRTADRAPVEEGEVVDVRDDARLERSHLVHRDRVVRPNGVVDAQRDLLLRLAVALRHLDHDRTFCRPNAEVCAKFAAEAERPRQTDNASLAAP